MGPQVRGYGYTHDGGADTVIRFASYPAFRYEDPDRQRREIEQYLFAFDSNLKPIVGQQITVNEANFEKTADRVDLLIERSMAGDAALVVHGVVDNEMRGYLLWRAGLFLSDRQEEDPLTRDQLLQLARLPGHSLTFTAAPKGSGGRMALDRDLDGVRDGDAGEQAAALP
jgi:hypothetical protein